MADSKTTIILEAKDNATATIGKVSTQMQSLGSVISKMPGLSSFGAGIAGAFAVNEIIKFIDKTIESYAALRDLSDITGSSIENLSGLRGVAESTGHSFDMVEGGLIKLSKALHSTDDESKGAGKALAAIGLNIGELADMDPSLVMLEIAKSLDQYQDSSSKAAVATAIFGKEGAKLLPYLKDLAEEGNLTSEATTKQAEAADQYSKNISRLEHNINSLARSIISALLPALDDMTTRMRIAAKNSEGFWDGVKMQFRAMFNLDDTQDMMKALAEAREIQDRISQGKQFAGDDKRLEQLNRELAFYRQVRNVQLQTETEKEKPKIDFTGDPKSPTKSGDRKAELSAELKAQVEAEQATIKAQLKARELIEDYKRLNAQTVERIEHESQLATMNERQRTIAEAMYRVEDDHSKVRERIIRDIEDEAAQSAALAEVDAEVARQKERVADATARSYDQMRTFEFGARKAFQSYTDDASNAAAASEKFFSDAMSGMEDSLVNFVQTGKLDFKSLADSLIADLIRIQVRAAMSQATSGIGSALSNLFGSSTSSSSGAEMTKSIGEFAQGGSFDYGMQFFADGGAFHNSVLHRQTQFFANGGLAVAGEVGPEAVMPLRRDSSGRLGVDAAGSVSGLSSIRVEIENNGTAQQVDGVQPSFDADGAVIRILLSDLSRNGPAAQGIMALTGSRRSV